MVAEMRKMLELERRKADERSRDREQGKRVSAVKMGLSEEMLAVLRELVAESQSQPLTDSLPRAGGVG